MVQTWDPDGWIIVFVMIWAMSDGRGCGSMMTTSLGRMLISADSTQCSAVLPVSVRAMELFYNKTPGPVGGEWDDAPSQGIERGWVSACPLESFGTVQIHAWLAENAHRTLTKEKQECDVHHRTSDRYAIPQSQLTAGHIAVSE